MPKDKTKTGLQNKHLHARVSYLHQAATYLAAQQAGRSDGPTATAVPDVSKAAQSEFAAGPPQNSAWTSAEGEELLNFQAPSFGGLPLRLLSHLAQVARKSQIRLDPTLKHEICKRCNTPLIEGQTCTKSMENLSNGGLKAHADVLTLQCIPCGAVKRWPVGAKRQERKSKRKHRVPDAVDTSTEVPYPQQNG